MTYKNIKFEDSEVMRSLEKIAIKKGLAKPDEIKKEANLKQILNLTPTKDLSENILKLCSGLRSNGFSKHAEEIEKKYLNLKSAETSLYNMIKEKGEDMIYAAHPDGSHSLKNMEGDSIVENVLDQAKKIREIAAKNPKGKLANYNAINMVKIVLADNDAIKKVSDVFSDTVNQMIDLCEMVNTAEDTSEISAPRGIVGFRGQYYTSQLGIASIGRHLNAMIDYLKNDKSKPFNVSLIQNRMKGYFPAFNYLISTATNISDDRKKMYLEKAAIINAKFSEIIQMAQKSADDAMNDKKNQVNTTANSGAIPAQNVSTNKSETDKFQERWGKAYSDLQSWKRRLPNSDLTPEEKTKGDKWLSQKLDQLDGIKNQLAQAKENKLDISSIISSTLNDEMDAIEKNNKDFYNGWIR